MHTEFGKRAVEEPVPALAASVEVSTYVDVIVNPRLENSGYLAGLFAVDIDNRVAAVGKW